MNKEQIKQKLLDLHPINHYIIDEYLDICFTRRKDIKINGDNDHHILSKALFPEYESFNDNPWNKACLSFSDHIIAHAKLYEAFPDKYRECASPFFRMSTLKTLDYETLDIILPLLQQAKICQSEMSRQILTELNKSKEFKSKAQSVINDKWLNDPEFRERKSTRQSKSRKLAWENAGPEEKLKFSERMKRLHKEDIDFAQKSRQNGMNAYKSLTQEQKDHLAHLSSERMKSRHKNDKEFSKNAAEHIRKFRADPKNQEILNLRHWEKNPEIFKMAQDIYDIWINNDKPKRERLARLCKLDGQKIQGVYQRISSTGNHKDKPNWVPNQDPLWISFISNQ